MTPHEGVSKRQTIQTASAQRFRTIKKAPQLAGLSCEGWTRYLGCS
jgi:hypothetical protein